MLGLAEHYMKNVSRDRMRTNKEQRSYYRDLSTSFMSRIENEFSLNKIIYNSNLNLKICILDFVRHSIKLKNMNHKIY